MVSDTREDRPCYPREDSGECPTPLGPSQQDSAPQRLNCLDWTHFATYNVFSRPSTALIGFFRGYTVQKELMERGNLSVCTWKAPAPLHTWIDGFVPGAVEN